VVPGGHVGDEQADRVRPAVDCSHPCHAPSFCRRITVRGAKPSETRPPAATLARVDQKELGSAPTVPNPAGRNGRGRPVPTRSPEPPLRPGDHRTHRVENQPPALDGADLLACDPALTDAVAREGAEEALPALRQ